MPICGIQLIAVAVLFVIGVIVGVLVILCMRFKGLYFRKRYGFKESEMASSGSRNAIALHTNNKETIDGSTALNEFKR